VLWHIALGIVVALLVAFPPSWKWQLGLRRVTVGLVTLGIGAGLVVFLVDAAVDTAAAARIALVALITLAAAVAILAYRFYRDPDREPPSGGDIVVSPADGEVVYVREARGGVLPVAAKRGQNFTLEELTKTRLRSDDAVIVGIGMSFLDVHVNRAPIGGRVTLRRHFPGLFGSLRLPEMVFRNERATTVIEHGAVQVAVVQIASRLVRQIAGYVGEGEEVAAGQRIGVIRLGSQVDVVLPAECADVTVGPGDRVRAGETIIARLR
jgi:phosphatidylserine decarboxylase